MTNLEGIIRSNLETALRRGVKVQYVRPTDLEWSADDWNAAFEKQEPAIRDGVTEACQTTVDLFMRRNETAFRAIEDYTERLMPWIDLLNREVKETFKSIDEPDTLCIIITGNKEGRYWTRNEYESRGNSDGET